MSENKPYFRVLHPPTFNKCQVIPSLKIKSKVYPSHLSNPGLIQYTLLGQLSMNRSKN